MRYDNFTFMMSLPRSRSFWMTEYFRCGANIVSLHDPMAQCASVDELGTKLDNHEALYTHDAPTVFIADTSLLLAHDAVRERFPNAKYLFLARDPRHVAASMMAAGMWSGAAETMMEVYCRRMEEAVYSSYGHGDFAMRLRYDLIDARLHNIWRLVMGNEPFDAAFAKRMIASNQSLPIETQRARTDDAKVARFLSTLNLHT